MKEVNKENDIFVSTLLNPEADVQDLLANNINVNNTEMSLPRESRERITDAVQSILKKLNRDQIEQQNQLKNSKNE